MATSRESRTRHSAADVVAAALRLLDEFGLPDLSMRALARELDVQPSALYWHFKNKQTLLAAVADEILAPLNHVPADADSGQIAVAFREAMLAVTDGAEVVVSTVALGLGADRAFERLRIALEARGDERAAALSIATTLVHYIIGHTSHEQQRAQALRLGVELEESAITANVNSFREGIERILAPNRSEAERV